MIQRLRVRYASRFRPNNLVDTHPRTRALRKLRLDPRLWNDLRDDSSALLSAHAACRFNYYGSKRPPFFQMVKTMAAILRATVRRAIVGLIPVASRAAYNSPNGPAAVLPAWQPLQHLIRDEAAQKDECHGNENDMLISDRELARVHCRLSPRRVAVFASFHGVAPKRCFRPRRYGCLASGP